MSSGGRLPGPPPLNSDDLLRCNTGRAMPFERWAERQAREQALRAEDARIADALESHGIPVRTGPADLVAVGLVTGLIEPVQSYRAVRFLPSIAQRDRRPLLNALRYFQQHHPGAARLRYLVVTAGCGSAWNVDPLSGGIGVQI